MNKCTIKCYYSDSFVFLFFKSHIHCIFAQIHRQSTNNQSTMNKFPNIPTRISKAIITLNFFLLINILSCQKEVTPYNIPDEKMAFILADIHISEGAVQHLSLTIRDSMAKVYFEQIMTIHKISIEKFEQDYQKLILDAEKLEGIYEKIIDRLNELKIKKIERKLER